MRHLVSSVHSGYVHTSFVIILPTLGIQLPTLGIPVVIGCPLAYWVCLCYIALGCSCSSTTLSVLLSCRRLNGMYGCPIMYENRLFILFEPCHEKNGFLHMRKQRRRSALR